MKDTKVETTADVLVRAFEMADEIENVIIIYERKKENPSARGNFLGCIESKDMTLERANFLVDSYKVWLWSWLTAEDEKE